MRPIIIVFCNKSAAHLFGGKVNLTKIKSHLKKFSMSNKPILSINNLVLCLCLIASLSLLEACKKDDLAPAKAPLTGEKKEYALTGSISGTVTFAKRSDNSTLVTIKLSDTDSHPAHVHDANGNIVIDFGIINNSTSKDVSSTTITYDSLIDLRNGYIAIHASSKDFRVIASSPL